MPTIYIAVVGKLQNSWDEFTGEGAIVSMSCSDVVNEDAAFYYIEPEKKMMKMVYPITHTINSFLMFASTPNEITMADDDYAYKKIYDFYFPRSRLRLMDSPACCVSDVRDILGCDTLASHIGWMPPLPPLCLNKAGLEWWLGSHLTDEPQGSNQSSCSDADWVIPTSSCSDADADFKSDSDGIAVA